jgi:hypothetical protein
VALVLEEVRGHGIKDQTIARAMNRLDYVGAFKGNVSDVLERLDREVFGPAVH